MMSIGTQQEPGFASEEEGCALIDRIILEVSLSTFNVKLKSKLHVKIESENLFLGCNLIVASYFLGTSMGTGNLYGDRIRNTRALDRLDPAPSY